MDSRIGLYIMATNAGIPTEEIKPEKELKCYDIVTQKKKLNKNDFKMAKGCIDYKGEEYDKMQDMFNILRTTITQFGDVVGLETPVFELREVMLGKYGEEADTKLVYHIEENGGERLTLRYDLTVPLSRHVIENGITKIKRYQYGKVYRRDQPNISHGRFREFYQYDFDMVGEYPRMEPEVTIMKLINMIMDKLNVKEYDIKYNYRNNLDLIYQRANIKPELFKIVSSTVDKLDKEPWENVEKELSEKGLTGKEIESVKVDIINNYLDDSLKPDDDYFKELCDVANVKHVKYDSSLARGLDYYTGMIYEVIVPSSGMGSVIGGGRFDRLISDYIDQTVPAIGLSFGLSRLLKLYNPEKKNKNSIYVCNMDKDAKYKWKVVSKLLDLGKTVISYDKNKSNIKNAISECINQNIDILIIIGDTESNNNTVTVKHIDTKKQETIKFEELNTL